MPHFVYILKSIKDGGYYVGETKNVSARLHFHNAGLQKSTRNRTPWEVIHVEVWSDRKEAFTREKQIKLFKGGEAFKKLISNG